MILTMGEKESSHSQFVIGKVRKKGTYTLGKADCRPSFNTVFSIFDGDLSCAHINDLKWMRSLVHLHVLWSHCCSYFLAWKELQINLSAPCRQTGSDQDGSPVCQWLDKTLHLKFLPSIMLICCIVWRQIHSISKHFRFRFGCRLDLFVWHTPVMFRVSFHTFYIGHKVWRQKFTRTPKE